MEIVWSGVDAERHSTPGNGCGDGVDAADARGKGNEGTAQRIAGHVRVPEMERNVSMSNIGNGMKHRESMRETAQSGMADTPAAQTGMQSVAQAGAQEEARAAQQASVPTQTGDVRWTPEQAEAITRRGQNLLVAAAAGSGKTAVLVERIKRLILEERCPIDRMLIVTFTNAAASEMKEKIEKAIRKEIERVAEALAAAGAEGSASARSLAEAKAEAEAGVDGAACGQDGNHAGKQSSARRDSSDAARAALQRDLVFLKRQLDLLPNANISTFHAFALEVIRRFFYLIDVEPNFKICDNSRQMILRGQAMDELLEEFFEADDAAFYEFLKSFSGDRNENRFRQMIESTFDTIQSLPEPAEWLREKVEELNPARGIEAFAESAVMRELWEDTEARLARAKAQLLKTAEFAALHSLEGVRELTLADLGMAEELETLAAARDFDGMVSRLDGFRLKTLSKKIFAETADFDESAMADVREMVEQNRAPLKSCAKDLKTAYFYDVFQSIAEDVHAGYPSACFFARALLRYGEIYAEKKREKGLLDFNDIEHNAYEILKDAEAAAFYREKFLHIFVDEYQDSNVIQEALIERLQSGRNLFTVGDIKQSIYMFRLAEPEIFRARYHRYDALTAEQGEESPSLCIDLNRNFRSKAGVLDFINQVFYDAMEDYDARAALYPGDSCAERRSVKPQLYLAQTPWDEDGEADDELKLLRKAEKEALAAVKIIRDHLGRTIYDSKARKERSLEKKDIVILMRGMKNYGDLFYKILTENNLPAYVDDNDGFFDTIEINTFMALLALLDNPKQDIPLLTVLRSEIFDFSVEELTAVRIAHKEGSYYQALASCAGENPGEAGQCICAGEDTDAAAAKNRGARTAPDREACAEAMAQGTGTEAAARKIEIPDGERGVGISAQPGEACGAAGAEPMARSGRFADEALREKCAAALRSLRKWSRLASLLPLDELIWELLLETGFYLAMGAMPSGSRRQANLRALVDKALAYQDSQDGSLYGFMEYIDAVKERKVSMGQVKMVGEDDDTIRIMTIHKSKGLEFPMVLLAGYCRKLNYTTIGKGPAVHKTLGLGFPVVHYRESWYRTSITQNVIRAKIRREEAAEEKRVLYVAMTRAKDFLCLLGIEDDPQEAVSRVLAELPKDSSYFSMTGRTICNRGDGYVFITNADLTGLSKGRRRAVANARALLEEVPAAAGKQKDAGASRGTSAAGAAAAEPVKPCSRAADTKAQDTGAARQAALPLAARIASQMEFRYPYENDLYIKSKYAVSELALQDEEGEAAADGPAAASEACASFAGRKHSAADAAVKAADKRFCLKDTRGKTSEITLAEPASFHARDSFTAAQIGTITHKVLEKLDFCAAQRAAALPDAEGSNAARGMEAALSQAALAPGAETQNAAAQGTCDQGAGEPQGIAYVRNLLARMVTEEFLTAEEAAVVDAEKIAAFANSPLGRRIAASPQLRREQPFNIMLEVNGSMAAVQGIIDCCFEEDGAWVLLDYKTTRIESAAELARRAPQLRKTYAAQMVIYRRALEAATGMPVRETYLYLTNLGETIRM